MARPPLYHSDAEKPVTVSLRMPRALYDDMQQYLTVRRMPLTEFLLDAIRLRLDTPADPRDILVSQDNTVIQELQEMIRAAVQKEIGTLGDFLGAQGSTLGRIPTPELSHDDKTGIQKKDPRGHTAPGTPKLTPRQVASLRKKRARGTPVKALMEEYGLSKATVFRYLK